MGLNKINPYFNENNSISILFRTLSVPSNQKMSSSNKFINFGMDFAMVLGPLIAYTFQIYKFNKTKSSKGFSKFICFLIFMGNIFRIFFWVGKHFKITLLYQSLGVVIFQVFLIHLSVKYQDNLAQKSLLPNINDKQKIYSEKSLIYYLLHWKNTFKLKQIWRWGIEIEYYKFMIIIIIILFILCQIFRNNNIFFNLIGVMSALFESMSCAPQAIENCKTKNSKNISFFMIFFWFLGDSFRLYYNIKFKAPIQILCANTIQVILDITVCVQIGLYNDGKSREGISKSFNKKKHIEEINKLMRSIDELNLSKNKKDLNYLIQLDLKKKKENVNLNQTNISISEMN